MHEVARGAEAATLRAIVSKTLVIAEKPSVGRDLARVLPGPFKKEEGYLEADNHIITWAVGHLVQLAAFQRFVRLQAAEPVERRTQVHEGADGWTMLNAQGSITAQYEHSLIITRERPILLTVQQR